MAKYNLSANTVVNCDILNESEGMYVVRFENGAINSVDKNRVHSLNDIDEGVLDMAKKAGEEISKFGRKVVKKAKDVAGTIKDFFVNAFKLGGFVFFKDENGDVLNVSHPVNAMIAAESDKSFNVYLSGPDVKLCNELGIEPRSIENYQFEGEYCGALQPEDLVNESYSKNKNSVLEGLYERAEDFIKGNPIDLRSPVLQGNNRSENLLEDFTQEEIVYTLFEEYEARLNGEEWRSLPTIIWGAPGIGKTQIVKNLIEILHEKHQGMEKPGMIVINARTIGPDSFSFPARVEKEESNIQRALRMAAWKKEHGGTEEYDFSKDAQSGRPSVPTGGLASIEDLPKSWMPVYNPDDPRGEEFIEIARKIANGGYVDKDGNVHDGPGGILFIDEYSRMTPDATTTLMNLPESRHFGDNSKTLGDRWVIVAAANRRDDLGSRAELDMDQNPTDAAINTRWAPVNFVPSFEDWAKWAKKKKNENQLNIHPQILTYVTSSVQGIRPNEFGYGDFYNNSDLDGSDMGSAEPKACPRSWESLSGRYYEYLAAVANSPDREKFLFNLFQKTANKEVGAPVGRRFIKFLKNIIFSDIDARNVWSSGKASAASEQSIHKFFSEGGDFKKTMMEVIIPKIETSLKNGKIIGEDKEKISEDILTNIINWIYSMCPADKGGNDTKNSSDLTDVFLTIGDKVGVNLFDDLDGTENEYANVINTVSRLIKMNNLAS